MATSRQHGTWIFDVSRRVATFALMLGIGLGLTVVATQAAQARTYTVIHNFTGGGDGANPEAGLTIDAAGSLYGTIWNGGIGYGTVFKLFRKNSNWVSDRPSITAMRDSNTRRS